MTLLSREHRDYTGEREMERYEVWKGPSDRGEGEKRRRDTVQRHPGRAGQHSRQLQAERGEEGGVHEGRQPSVCDVSPCLRRACKTDMEGAWRERGGMWDRFSTADSDEEEPDSLRRRSLPSLSAPTSRYISHFGYSVRPWRQNVHTQCLVSAPASYVKRTRHTLFA